MKFRTDVRASDAAAVRTLVEATGFFSAEEAAIALELVETEGYSFVFAEDDQGLLGYTCYGAVPAASGSFDLYWIAVHPRGQGSGTGKKLMEATVSAIRALGGRKIWIETSGRAQYVPTRAFYSKCGFRIAATLDDFYSPGDAKVIFEKTISR